MLVGRSAKPRRAAAVGADRMSQRSREPSAKVAGPPYLDRHGEGHTERLAAGRHEVAQRLDHAAPGLIPRSDVASSSCAMPVEEIDLGTWMPIESSNEPSSRITSCSWGECGMPAPQAGQIRVRLEHVKSSVVRIRLAGTGRTDAVSGRA